MYDMNDAELPRGSDLIPDSSFVKVTMTIRPGGLAVLNADDARVAAMAKIAAERDVDVLWFGRGPDAQVRADDVVVTASGTSFQVTAHGVNMTFPVEFKVTRSADGKVIAEGEHTFKRSDFKIGKAEGAEGEGTADKVQIKMRLTLESAG